jgi:adenylyl- and sulfurtransferase ThiI
MTDNHAMTTPRKAVALISGGLDSLLAARLMLDQGIHVEGINFYTGFCVEGHTHAIRKKTGTNPSATMRYGVPNSSASSCISLILLKNTRIS